MIITNAPQPAAIPAIAGIGNNKPEVEVFGKEQDEPETQDADGFEATKDTWLERRPWLVVAVWS